MHQDTKPRGVQAARSAIPKSNAPGVLTVTNGQITVGTIVARGGSHFAFLAAGVLIGEYRTRPEAMRALRRGVS
jgi:hypothetical protein